MTHPETRLDIFADPTCPWCLIGQTALDLALDSRPGHPFVLTWHPFRLDPSIPPQGLDRVAYLRASLGQGADAAARALAEHAAALNLTLNPSDRQPDTTDAHRLMHWAGPEGAQPAVMAGLLRAHWHEARDIGDPATLTRIAENAGMDGAVTARLLASDADRDDIARRDSHARQRGIASVPTYVVADAHAISGAQSVHLWQQVIDEIMAATRRA